MPNSACGTPFGQTIARDVDRRARAEAEVHRRASDHLLLRQQARSHFDVAADAERVDALIAGVLLRARTEHFPVVARRALAEPARRSAAGHADQIEQAVGVEIDDTAKTSPSMAARPTAATA